LKSTSYAENAIALAWAKARGYSEAVMGNLAGNLCEGTGSNIFIVMDDEILTPPITSGCLAGVTRDLVIEWCGAKEQEMSLDVLEHADEIFLTSSTRDVHPVDRIAGRTLEIGHETIGAREIFRQRCSDIDP
jgi:branched-chain amino acid aminotransferase